MAIPNRTQRNEIPFPGSLFSVPGQQGGQSRDLPGLGEPRAEVPPAVYSLPDEIQQTIFWQADHGDVIDIRGTSRHFLQASEPVWKLDQLIPLVLSASPDDPIAVQLTHLSELQGLLQGFGRYLPESSLHVTLEILRAETLATVERFYKKYTPAGRVEESDQDLLCKTLKAVLTRLLRFEPRDAARLLLDLMTLDQARDDAQLVQVLEVFFTALNTRQRTDLMVALYRALALNHDSSNSRLIKTWQDQALSWNPQEKENLAERMIETLDRMPRLAYAGPKIFADFFALTRSLGSNELNERFLRATIDKAMYTLARNELEPEDHQTTLETFRVILDKARTFTGKAGGELFYLLEASSRFHFGDDAEDLLKRLPASRVVPGIEFKIQVLTVMLNNSVWKADTTADRLEALFSSLPLSARFQILNAVNRHWFGDVDAPWEMFLAYYLSSAEDFCEHEEAQLLGKLGQLMCSENDQSRIVDILFIEDPLLASFNIQQRMRKFSPENKKIVLCGLVQAFEYLMPNTGNYRKIFQFIFSSMKGLPATSKNLVWGQWVQARNRFIENMLDLSVHTRAMQRICLGDTDEIETAIADCSDLLAASSKILIATAKRPAQIRSAMLGA